MIFSPDNEFKSALLEAVAGFALDPLSEGQIVQLEKHYALLGNWNQRINLTRIVTARDAAQFHYAESLFGARFLAGERTLLDIGSGAGFPAIPLAIARPDIQVTALEANHKKSMFLREAKDELGLVNLEVATARLEEFDWTGFDMLASRALDRAEAMLPSVIERLRAKQRLMLYCGPDLVARIDGQVRSNIETHPIPHSEARVIALFSQE